MTTKQAQQAVKDAGKTWEEFISWMSGQTVGMDENGDTDWYDDDVERFVRRSSHDR